MYSTYPIQRWDSIMNKGGLLSHPALYINPTPELMKYIQEHNFVIPVKIVDTLSGYDNTLTYVQVQPSQYTGGYRPNFQKVTNSIVFIADIPWNGYPTFMGKVHVLVDTTSTETFEPIQQPIQVPSYPSYPSYPSSDFDDYSTSTIKVIPCCILIWIVIIIIICFLHYRLIQCSTCSIEKNPTSSVSSRTSNIYIE